MDKFQNAECECGNCITYMTLRNQIKCQKCGSMIDVIPCQPEDFEIVEEKDTPAEE